ncbi:MAG TPA: FAD-dependent monooxygenase [Microbacterium sp.]|nr:FAD-dependent monooxygenase [Microbacterium sp.]
MNEIEVPVLIAGGSLVGLTTSLLLSAHGVRNLVVERHRGTAIHPRAAMLHQRTTEVIRELGLADAVRVAADQEFVQNGAIMAAEALGGKELVYFQTNVNEGVDHLSPEPRLFITQIGLEPILRAETERQGAENRFATELVDFEQDEDGVRSVIRHRDTGETELVRSSYLVATDGAHSSVRERLGIRMLGHGDFANCITIYFKADIDALIGDRNLSVIYVNHPALLGFFRYSIQRDGGFLVVFAGLDENGEKIPDVGANADTEACLRYVRTALGASEDLPITIENVQQWAASAGWAEHYREGRVFLAGDSAHVMPPTGGFGGNTGIVDAHNLAWKIAAVLQGKASEALLDSYEPERRPAGRMTSEQAYSRYVLRVDPTLGADDIEEPLDDVAIELGPVYSSAAVIGAEPGADPVTQNPREPGAHLGARAPHLWVSRDGRQLSLLDTFGRGFALLTGAGGQAWLDAAAPLEDVSAYRVAPDGDLTADEGAFEAAYAIPADGAVLVRPDGVIAWRAEHASDGSATDLTDALGQILRGVASSVK